MLAEGGIDILINNSGGPAPGEARSVDLAAWNAGFESMVTSVISLNQQLLPEMIERKWGRIISLTSSGVEVPISRLAISNGLRQALIGWSKTLAAEVAADGVTVNIIVQGRIHTDRVDQLTRPRPSEPATRSMTCAKHRLRPFRLAAMGVRRNWRTSSSSWPVNARPT